jgi:hypothetical protein
MKIPNKVKLGWEHRFPDLSGKWTHWKIMGDGDCIDVVDGMDLVKALAVVEKNFGKFGSIKVSRATVDADGQLLEVENHFSEISNFIYDERECVSEGRNG